MEEAFIRGVNWVPDSDNDTETEVPDSQDSIGVHLDEIGTIEAKDVTLILMQLASIKVSIFDTHKHLHEVADLMLPLLLPCLYGKLDSEVHEAASTLQWMASC